MPKFLLVAAIAILGGLRVAHAQTAQFRVDGKPHVDVPFELDLIVQGFDEAPVPPQPALKLANATVTPLGATPNVSRSIQIINGRRSETAEVQWVLRWRVEVHREGPLEVPQTSVVQGSHSAVAHAGNITVDTIPTTEDMKLQLVLPDRPVFVGETVPVELVWLFRQQPEDQAFAVPLMTLDDLTVSTAPVTDKKTAFPFAAGAKQIPVPYDADTTEVNGQQFHRIKFTFFVAPRRLGKIEVPASSVVASLAVGRRDFFGNAATRPFRALDVAHTMQVQALPESDKPANFAGAVGEQFSIAVKTSRSVVQLGEPVDLEVTIKSNQRLDNFSLGRIAGDGGLPKDRFTVPDEVPTGELAEDGLTKTFHVSAQVTGPATEIPAIALAYFDPAKRTYQTIHSDPIALAVKGGSIIGADSVVTATPKKGNPAATITDDTALVDAQLALSTVGADDQPLGGWVLWLIVGLLYAVPLGVFGLRTWQIRTSDAREDAAEVRLAKKRFDAALDRAKTAPAREAAGPLGAAVREVARALEIPVDDGGLLAKLETEAFAPSAAELPMTSEIRTAVAALVDRWLRERRAPAASRAVGVALVLLVALAPHAASADPLAEARATYSDAMTRTDATSKRAAFERAAAALKDVAAAHPNPEILADWGNAALGAGDVATATLAYRRALLADSRNARARQNLGLLRSRQPAMLRPADGGAANSLFFFHRWPRAWRMVVGGIAFAIAVFLVVPWRGRRRRGLVNLAILPVIVWLAMMVSLVVERTRTDDAVVMDDAVLRAADSAGAPAAMLSSLPRGTEVNVVEHRGNWTRIAIANGTSGWVPSGTLEAVAR